MPSELVSPPLTSYALVYFWNISLARGSGFLSGCHSAANLRYARLIANGTAVRFTPRTSAAAGAAYSARRPSSSGLCRIVGRATSLRKRRSSTSPRFVVAPKCDREKRLVCHESLGGKRADNGGTPARPARGRARTVLTVAPGPAQLTGSAPSPAAWRGIPAGCVDRAGALSTVRAFDRQVLWFTAQ
eukprot:scaffold12780_cov88-Isochrysis_galbana.AAC.2